MQKQNKKESGDYVMISIITPAYNVEKHIERCVRSILEQTEKDFELILVDDGSTDGTANISDELSRIDNRIKVIHKENGGVSSARNMGLKKSSGEYITFIDSDDWIEKDYLESLLSDIKKFNSDIACCNYVNDDGKNAFGGKTFESKLITRAEALDCYSKYYFTSVWGKLYKKAVLKDLFFRSDLSYSEDTLFYTRALTNANSVYWNNRKLYHYFSNSAGAMNTFVLNKRVTDFFARLEIAEIYNDYPELKDGAICRAVSSAISIEFLSMKKNEAYEKQDILKKYIKDNYKIYIKNPVIERKDKIICLICSNPLLKKIFSLIFKLKA